MSTKVFIKNLHENIDDTLLHGIFCVFGNILSCKVVTNDAGKSQGYGYINYDSNASAIKAIDAINGIIISGKKVYVELFKSFDQRKAAPLFTNVYVKYIPRSMNREQLIELFEKVTNGQINSAKYWTNDYGVSACLNFVRQEDAAKAVDLLNGYEIKANSMDENKDGNESNDVVYKLYVARSQNRKERDDLLRQKSKKNKEQFRKSLKERTVYVGNLSDDINDLILNNIFSKYGVITSVKIKYNRHTKKSRGFGFVTFKEKNDATRAINEMNNYVYNGKELRIDKSLKKQKMNNNP